MKMAVAKTPSNLVNTMREVFLGHIIGVIEFPTQILDGCEHHKER